jgi:hypothetical protein
MKNIARNDQSFIIDLIKTVIHTHFIVDGVIMHPSYLAERN